MTRYIIQTDQYSCGTHAFLNILNYYGANYTKKDIITFNKLLGTDEEYGTATTRIAKELRNRGIKFGRRTYKYDPNKTYLACYISRPDKVMHYILITPGTTAINWHAYKNEKMYTRYKLPKSWITSRLRRKSMYLWRISK